MCLYYNDLVDYQDVNTPVLDYVNEYVEIVFDNLQEVDLEQQKVYTFDKQYTYQYLIVAEDPYYQQIKRVDSGGGVDDTDGRVVDDTDGRVVVVLNDVSDDHKINRIINDLQNDQTIVFYLA